jgi:hypothetical protein
MYIKTENNGIINPHHYDKIDVYAETDGSYTLRAFMNPLPESIDTESLIISTYNKKADADDALLHLFKSLTSGERTWDPSAVSDN